jgi:hypothetical protein
VYHRHDIAEVITSTVVMDPLDWLAVRHSPMVGVPAFVSEGSCCAKSGRSPDRAARPERSFGPILFTHCSVSVMRGMVLAVGATDDGAANP